LQHLLGAFDVLGEIDFAPLLTLDIERPHRRFLRDLVDHAQVPDGGAFRGPNRALDGVAEGLRAKAAETEAQLRARGEVLRERARGYYDDARVRGREYYDEAQERFDEAQRYLTERVQERPTQSTAIALGVGVVLGLLLAGRRR